MMITLRSKNLLALLIAIAALGQNSQAQLPPAPSGFTWEFQNNASYADADTFSTSLDGTQTLAPAGAPVVSSLAETLSLSSFDVAGAEATLEADNPGMDYAIVVLSSNFSASLSASASTEIFNFDTTFASHDYSGTTSASNFQISGAGTAGPTTDSLVNSSFTVPAFSIGAFADGTSAATTATVSLSDTGVAPTDGSTLNFNYSGSSILAVFSDDPSATNQLAVLTSTGFGSAEVNTGYAVYKLVSTIPEPNSVILSLLAGVMLIRRRRR